MKILKILPIIAITLLAACKSTVPQTESLLEEHVSTAGEISSSSDEIAKPKYANPKDSVERFEQAMDSMIYAALHFIAKDNNYNPCGCSQGVQSCSVLFNGNLLDYSSELKSNGINDQLQLNVLSVLKNVKTSLTISNETAFVREEFSDYYKDTKLAEFCVFHKNDPKVKNVECIDKVITFSLNDNYRDIDLKTLAKELYSYCDLWQSRVCARCGPNHMRNQHYEEEGLKDLE